MSEDVIKDGWADPRLHPHDPDRRAASLRRKSPARRVVRRAEQHHQGRERQGDNEGQRRFGADLPPPLGG